MTLRPADSCRQYSPPRKTLTKLSLRHFYRGAANSRHFRLGAGFPLRFGIIYNRSKTRRDFAQAHERWAAPRSRQKSGGDDKICEGESNMTRFGQTVNFTTRTFAAAAGAAVLLTVVPALAAWEPTRPVEIIVPAGTGGGADQMARVIQGIVTKHKLMNQSMVVINKAGGAGGEGFLDVKSSKGNPHKLVITLSNLFTTPLGTGLVD